MKCIGLIGGMSWESTVEYYRFINRDVRDRLGGQNSARLLLYSVNFHDIEACQHTGDWKSAGTILAEAAAVLERGGADFLILATNTMHKVAPAIEAAVRIPLVHIADPTGEALRKAGIRKVGLLATAYTMEETFYKERLRDRFQLDVCVPEKADRQVVHSVIYDELCLGKVLESSRAKYQKIVERLAASGAEAIILGCTEIGLLLKPADSKIPLFDTTRLHCGHAVDLALDSSHGTPVY